MAGLQIVIEQANGSVLCEGVLGLDSVFEKMVDGRATHSVPLKIEGRPCVGAISRLRIVSLFVIQRSAE